MVVEKAVKMAEMMSVPILGVVENMSYLMCPGCGREIPLFLGDRGAGDIGVQDAYLAARAAGQDR